jgi:hypothetical protein
MIDTYTVRRNLDGVVTVAGMMIGMVAVILLTFVVAVRCWNPSTDHATMLVMMVVTFAVWSGLMWMMDQFVTFTIENADAMHPNEWVLTTCAFAATFAGYPMIHNLFVDSIPIPPFTLYTMVNWWIWMGIAIVVPVLVLYTHLPKMEDL